MPCATTSHFPVMRKFQLMHLANNDYLGPRWRGLRESLLSGCRSSPQNTRDPDGPTASTIAASSVKSTFRVSRCASTSRRLILETPVAFARPTKSARSGVCRNHLASSPTTLMVSLTGTAAMAAPVSPYHITESPGSDTSGGDAGARAIVDGHPSAFDPCANRPAYTESCRRAPPAQTAKITLPNIRIRRTSVCAVGHRFVRRPPGHDPASTTSDAAMPA